MIHLIRDSWATSENRCSDMRSIEGRSSERALGDTRCAEAAEFIRQNWSKTPKAGIILGTGLGQLANHMEREVVFPYCQIPNFLQTTALGHNGQLVCGSLNGVPIVAFDGRFHCYEGYSCDDITRPVAVMHRLGAELLLLSNASGGLNPRLRSGDILVMADHIDLMGRRTACLSTNHALPCRSGRAVPYDPELIELAQEVARENGFHCVKGTYVAVLGPNYETRAEYRAMRRLGGDAVGMSTIPEVLAAIRCGLRVLALSTVTNVACPDALTTTLAQDVVDMAAQAEPKLRRIVMGVLDRYFLRNQ